MAKYPVRLATMQKVRDHYDNVKPIRGTNTRPIGCRGRKHEEIRKVDDNTFHLGIGWCSYLDNGAVREGAFIPYIEWHEDAKGVVTVTIMNGIGDFAHCSIYTFHDYFMPEGMWHSVSNGKQFVQTGGATKRDYLPKGGGSDGGISREDIVYEKASELLKRLPEDYEEDAYKAKIRKLGGMTIPMNIFLFQEIQRFQNVISKVRFTLTQLQLAIKGEVVMTAELQETLDSMFDARVPHYWENTLTGDEFSWRLPTLGLWFSSLLNRESQYRTWLNSGRPNSFWLTGFFNPNGCLTAMKQEVTRKHKSQKWACKYLICVLLHFFYPQNVA